MFSVNLVLVYHNLSIQTSGASVQTQIFQRRTSSPFQGYWDISIPWGWRRSWSLKHLCVWTIWRGCKLEKDSLNSVAVEVKDIEHRVYCQHLSAGGEVMHHLL